MSKSYVSDYGLPRAVESTDKLPKTAFVGHVCYVEADDDAGLYVYDGEEYSKVSASTDSDGSSAATGVTAPTYSTVSALPAGATAGDVAFATSTHSLYFYTGSAWTKLGAAATDVIAPTSASTDAFPANPTAGQLAWCSDASDKGLYVYDGSAWKKATIS